MNRDETSGEIDLRQIISVIRRSWAIILAGTLLFAVIAVLYCSFVAVPQYTATTQVLIKVSPASQGTAQSEQQITQTMITTAQNLVPTFIEILKSPTVLDAVIENIPYDYHRDQIKRMISASVVSSTAIMEIKVKCDSPEHAMIIANTIQKYGVPEIIRLYGAGSVIELVNAELPKEASSPETAKTTVLAAFIGLVLTCVVCVLAEVLDTKVKVEQDLTNAIDIPLIGVIPSLKTDSSAYTQQIEVKEGGRK